MLLLGALDEDVCVSSLFYNHTLLIFYDKVRHVRTWKSCSEQVDWLRAPSIRETIGGI